MQAFPRNMSSIRILSDRVANQIAAGEVIERPVAVVKELVENCIDAGATRIEVEFRNGGKSYIRIEDNGKGMSPDEALLCLERHATSKIREAADLNEVCSFGFRGEALPSIASVSKFTLRTRAKEWDHGTEILINGGKMIDKKDCGMPVGTVIEVAHLFNSVPARRKFLKTDPTETAHITYNCRLFAVAHPNVAFRVLENGRTVFQSPACENLRDRIAEIWGRSLADDLIPVDVSDPKTGFRLTGLTAKPGVGRSTRRELVTLVNRRPVDSRTLSLAVLDAYHGRIQKGRFPPAFLFLEIKPQEVDVNVHPAKREVRFRDDGAIRRFVLNAVTETLAASRADDIAQTIAPSPATIPEESTSKPEPKTKPSLPKTTPAVKVAVLPTPSQAIRPAATPAAPKVALRTAPQPVACTPEPSATPAPAVTPAPTPAPKKTTSGWRLITLLKKRYALFDTTRGLVMLHLRHADQRVRFERISKEFKDETPPSQRLLIPHPLEFEPLASEALKSQLKQLNAQGFQVEEFGRNFYRIEAVPTWLSPEQAESFIRDLVDLVRQRGGMRKQTALGWEAVARLAVEGSYRRSDSLTEQAVEQLAKDLLACETPHTSPFGKPTFSEVSWGEWERRFGSD
ncbi:DNA mismatch repair protein MutL [Lentimonas sp. CC19]|uniref:DNA mismatch repair endonuclease MutL n=2 Tax=Lentimonas TaxID=417293 RepID=UPI0013275779|nr:DNA mismatch repair endonuclease MutL [Lentimonas sp. CC19]CAA6694488.1 DNA mismatch repair protein MutL [Lentimonas sp. CC19]CAA6697112.1 DNA mismatch repair protein MutL [Lentimonas sp. CC10]CAA7069560.1 DNA mismatch repair protein MutL [Lentimonas sp. CC11]